MWLFYALTGIMRVKKAFMLVLVIVASSFFLELASNFYVDLTYFLLFSIFLVYFSIFHKDPKRHNLLLCALVFLLFLAKNTSYLLLPSFIFFMALWFLVTRQKRDGFNYIYRLLLIVSCGFLAYFIFSLGFSLDRMIEDIWTIGGEALTGMQGSNNPSSIISFAGIVLEYLAGLRFVANSSMFNKFGKDMVLMAVALYLIVSYNIYQKKNSFFVAIFIFSESFFFFLFNILGNHHELRYFLPFYLVYIYLFYDFFDTFILKGTTRGIHFFLGLLIVYAIYNGYNFFILKETRFSRYADAVYSFDEVPFGEEGYSYVFIPREDDRDDYNFYYFHCFVDESYQDYLFLQDTDPKFRFIIVKDEGMSDYVLCYNCTGYDTWVRSKEMDVDGDSLFLLKNNKAIS
jgi:hypothetical protein